jgi:hypothetical protein
MVKSPLVGESCEPLRGLVKVPMKPNTGWDTSGTMPVALFCRVWDGVWTMLWPQKLNTWLTPRAQGRAQLIGLVVVTAGAIGGAIPAAGVALPPPDDTPEEVLRTQVITEARSPVDGKPMSAAEYAQLQEQLQDVNRTEAMNSDLAQLIFFLQARRVIRPILPFIP